MEPPETYRTYLQEVGTFKWIVSDLRQLKAYYKEISQYYKLREFCKQNRFNHSKMSDLHNYLYHAKIIKAFIRFSNIQVRPK